VSKYLLPDFKNDLFSQNRFHGTQGLPCATVWLAGPGLPSGGGSDRGAYRIEIQSLSTGPVVRGTCVPDLPIIPTHINVQPEFAM